jgi:hypothetical protein
MRNIFRKLFYDYNHRGDNGIIGPGFQSFSYYSFSYFKLIVILLLGFIIVYNFWMISWIAGSM